MEIETRHTPSFGVARSLLGGGEVIKVEAGAMMAHSPGVELEAKMEGGLLKGLKRSVLGGESLFVTTFTAPAPARTRSHPLPGRRAASTTAVMR